MVEWREWARGSLPNVVTPALNQCYRGHRDWCRGPKQFIAQPDAGKLGRVQSFDAVCEAYRAHIDEHPPRSVNAGDRGHRSRGAFLSQLARIERASIMSPVNGETSLPSTSTSTEPSPNRVGTRSLITMPAAQAAALIEGAPHREGER
jgi:hypothetical protein